MIFFALLACLNGVSAQVTATGTNGVTNPPAPSFAAVGSTVNESSESRLASLNSVDDFCLYAPATSGDTIGDLEAEVVAYCTKPRNNARLIPDGTITNAHTPLYVQVYGLWDGTKVNIKQGDYGGELDPHGATGLGNPVGGNVTSDVTGQDVFYQEWMQYVAYDSFCFRICTAENSTVSAAEQCQHTLDLMGCDFVMDIPDMYDAQYPFTECDGDASLPPGLYPLANGSTSTFAQRYTGTYTVSSTDIEYFTVGVTVTPSAPAWYPATSNCMAYSTISNGINIANPVVTASPAALAGGSSYGAVAPVQPTSNSTNSTTTASTTSGTTTRIGAATMTTGSGVTTTSAESGGAGSSASATASKSAGESIRGPGGIVCLALMASILLV